MVLLIIGGALFVGWLERQRSRGASDRRSLS
jgi:hypothetical protein